jgi:hypothetical protein
VAFAKSCPEKDSTGNMAPDMIAIFFLLIIALLPKKCVTATGVTPTHFFGYPTKVDSAGYLRPMSNEIDGVKGFLVKNENLATEQRAHYHQK